MNDESSGAPTAAFLIIGNEILSGRTQDQNLAHLASRLGTRGIQLLEARIVPDIEAVIIAAVSELRASYDLVFTSGGIGPTHDDITADCLGAAFGVPVDIHPEARRRLAAFCDERGIELNEDRLRMARIPAGAQLIDNPVSVAPGFVIGNVHVMAGVPRIMQAMLENLLPSLPSGPIVGSVCVTVLDLGEGDIATPLRELQSRWPQVDLGSYPGRVDGRFRVELVARSADEEALSRVHVELRSLLTDLVEERGGALLD